MHMLYDSDSFIVVHIQTNSLDDSHLLNVCGRAMLNDKIQPKLPRNGFEILNKHTGKEVFLDGSWAELFQRHLEQWMKVQPSQEEVECTLTKYAELAQTPINLN